MPAKRRRAAAARREAEGPAAGRPIVVVGASAGGIEALRTLAASLPPNLEAALFVVLHIGSSSLGMLPEILTRSGPLAAASAVDGEKIRNGRIYVAPPDRHLLVERGKVRLTRDAREHRFRPAVDPLFRSAAEAYGPQVIGVVLSGTLGDGALGLRAVKEHGGVAVVQDPRDALFQSMPLRALETVAVDHLRPVARMGVLIARLCREQGGTEVSAPSEEAWTPAMVACPDCGGAISQQDQPGGLHFRCHVGHAYDTDSLLQAQDDTIETALLVAARALAEKAAILRQLSARSKAAGREAAARNLDGAARLFAGRRDVLMRSLSRGAPVAEPVDLEKKVLR